MGAGEMLKSQNLLIHVLLLTLELPPGAKLLQA